MADVAGREQPADVTRRDVVDERDSPDVEAHPFEQVEIPAPVPPEAERLAGGDHFRPRGAQDRLGELLGVEQCERLVERQQQHVLDAHLLEQLEPALDRREQLHAVAEERARVRVEGDDRGAKVRRLCRLDHSPVAAVDTVEGADGHRTPCRRELLGSARDVHVARSARAFSTRPSTSASGMSSPGSNSAGATASDTSNGPTSVRRSVRQCPPAASAMARM